MQSTLIEQENPGLDFDLESITLGKDPVVSVQCDEPEGSITRHVYPLVFTYPNTVRFWEKARKHRTIFGRELHSPVDLMNMLFTQTAEGIESTGLFWVVDNFEGVFYVTNIDAENDGLVHYSFFSGRHKGRENLVRGMLGFIFDKYNFRRLSAEIPCYVKPSARHFAQTLGFQYEGKRRKVAFYKDDWFDLNLYGLLRNEFTSNLNSHG